MAQQPAIRDALAGHESMSCCRSNGMLQLVTVPIAIGLAIEILGTLSVGFLDDVVAGS